MKILMLGSGSYKSSLSFRPVCFGKQLARRGWDVTLIVPSADKYNGFKPDKHARLDPIRLIQPWQLSTKSVSLNLLPYLLTSLIAVLRAKADVVYITKPTPVTIAGLLPKLLFRTPVVLDLDDLGSEVMKAQGQSAIQAKLVALCERLTLRFASAVVVATTYLESSVHAQYPNKAVLVLPNGVDTGEYHVPEDQPPRHAVYYFGALNRLSLIEDLLRALPAVLQAVPDTTITILGGGSALDTARKLAKQLGVARAVTFSGWIDMFAAQNYVQFADIAVCYQPDTPTMRAASNMKIFQYMAMRSVPVVGDVGDGSTYIDHGQAGVAVTPENPAELAGTLISLLQNDAQRTAIAQRARQRAETVYAWEHLSRRLAKFITDNARSNTATESLEGQLT